MRRPLPNRHHLKQSAVLRGTFGKLSIALIVLASCTVVFLFSSANDTGYGSRARSKIEVDELWNTVDSEGWRPSSAPRSEWRTPPAKSNGYLRVRCNGGLNQQCTAICNAVLAARIMNATLVLPELDANSFWHDDSNIDIQNPEDDTIYSTFSGFRGLYDVEHFIETPKSDVRIVESIPEICKNGKVKKIKAFQLRPDRDAPISWYQITALEKMKQHGAIYLTPFSHRLAEEIGNAEYQRLRCRVNYHALQFKPHIMKLSNSIVRKLREEGHFMSIHLRFEMDMLAIAGCFDIFTPKEQKILQKYRIEKFSEKELVPSQRRAIGNCPLTPEEVGLVMRAIGFDNSTRIYLAAGELFGGERFMKPFRHFSLVWKITVLWTPPVSWLRILVDWQALLLTIWSAYFPTFSCQHTMAPSNFANNLLGHRLYYGFRTNIRPDRKALAPILIDREKGKKDGFEEAVRRAMIGTNFGGPNKRIHPESFYTNSWPECFCQMSPANPADKCPLDNALDILDTRTTSEDSADMDPSSSSNSTMSVT